MREWRPRRRVCQGQPEQADIALKLRLINLAAHRTPPAIRSFTTSRPGLATAMIILFCPQAFRSPKSSASLSPDQTDRSF